MQNGFLYLRYDFGFSSGPVLLEDSMRKARINDAKFHEVQMCWLSQVFGQLSQRLQAEIIALMAMKGAKGWGTGGDMVEQAEEQSACKSYQYRAEEREGCPCLLINQCL